MTLRDDGDVRYLRGLFHLLLHPFGLVGVGDLLLLTLRQRDAVGVFGEAGKGKGDALPLQQGDGTVGAGDGGDVIFPQRLFGFG